MIFINSFWNGVKIQPFGGFRLLIHEIAEALGRSVAKPFINGDAVSRGFRNFLSLVVKEQFIDKMLRLFGAKKLTNSVINRGIGGVIFAVHFKINT